MFGFGALGELALGQAAESRLLTASFTVTEAQDVANFSVDVTSRTAELHVVEAQDVASITSEVIARASFHVMEVQDVASITSEVIAYVTLGVTEPADYSRFWSFTADFVFGDGEVACVPQEERLAVCRYENRDMIVPPKHDEMILPYEDRRISAQARRRAC